MVQLNYDTDFTQALAGTRVDAGVDYVISRAAQEIIPFGVVIGSVAGQADQCRAPIANSIVVTDDGGAWTALDLVVVISGVTITTTFSSNKATSMALVATNIAALDFISTAVYDSGNDIITIVARDNVALSVTVDVSGITGNMTIDSIVASMTDRVLGISLRDTIEAGSSRVEVNDRALFTLSGDVLASSDTVNGVINGVALTEVTFATSEAVTLQLVANAIKRVAGVSNAVIDTALRTVDITMNAGLPLNSASLTVVDDSAGTAAFDVGVFSAQGVNISRNVAKFAPTETVPVERKGQIHVQCEEDMTPASSVFFRIQATASFAQRGRLRTDIDSGTAIATSDILVTANSFTDVNGQRVVPVELNLP